MKTKMYEFKTKNFSIVMHAEEDYDIDLSFDEDGSVRKGLETGEFIAFGVVCTVYYRGMEVGQDSLWGCIYRNLEEFRDHFGCKPKGYGSYFSDMIRESIREARKTINTLQTIRLRHA